MAGNADAAAHDETLHEGDIGLGIFGNQRVEAVFVLPEGSAEIEVAPGTNERASSTMALSRS